MPNAITLTVTKGSLSQREYRFEEREHLILGRMPDCRIQVPNDDAFRLISRYHCHLDIALPSVALRDYGSRNGTYLNGELIGKRNDDESAEEGRQRRYPDRLLKDGDVIRLADAIELKVKIEHEPRTADIYATGNGSVDGLDDAYKTRKEKALVATHIQAALQDYEFLNLLGKGSYGEVMLARHRPSGQLRAVKLLVPHVYDGRAREEFKREIDISKQLTGSQNVVQLYEYVETDDFYALVLEYCDGGEVAQQVAKRLYEPREAVALTLQLLSALDYAHKAPVKIRFRDGSVKPAIGVVHRDIKPSNILLKKGPQPIAKLADLGIAKAFDLAGMSGLSRTGIGEGYAGGTLAFMSRTQCVEFKYSKPDVDIWATAATLYYMLTGKTPRTFSKNVDPYEVVLNNDPTPIRKYRSDIPAKLADVIDAALVDKPFIKVATAAELHRQLERLSL